MEILKLREHKELTKRAAEWFHLKWDIPAEAYEESIRECQAKKEGVPQWYIVLENNEMIAGVGVIENDFHERKDLTPNVCALYVEEKYRCRGIAGKLLKLVRDDMENKGISPLYLITEHTSFYERHGWEFLCMVKEEDSNNMIRMYVHQ